ncbi:hypothetical protein [Schumannella sp. 10F1B-5-1]|uniref:hypothetical protein n=1 Tax=Schumannella sp. 10F1B-5-1 TaxID=2590780 RepID=UPI0011328449|nr:hypothetical protein [Schumannella sp. 10F1B-5-1]TPW71650.1 hypothetical protein FJ658_09870 [Schumannella sp. 10F1B-5-1]
MSTPESPRSQPPSVYRRRRLVVFGGLAVVIIVILLIVWPRGDARDVSDVSPSPSPSTSKGLQDLDPSGAPADGDVAACAPSTVKIEAVLDASSYGGEQQPQLSMSITNSSATACSVDVGTAVQEYIITSGEDRIWDSKDCQSDATNDVRTIKAGETLSTTPLAWDRTRSDPATCDQTSRTPAIAGGATYRLQVKLGDLESETKIFLLN